jgi:hypothetical protein
VATAALAAGRWYIGPSVGTGAGYIPSYYPGATFPFDQTTNPGWGCSQFTTGTSASGQMSIQRGGGYPYIASGANLTTFWEFEFRVAFGTVPTSALNCTYFFGFMDNPASIQTGVGICLAYKASPGGACWFGRYYAPTANDYGNSLTPTVNPVGTSPWWYKLRVWFDGSMTNFSVNGTVIAQQLGSIGGLNNVRATVLSIRSAGTTTTLVYIDYYFLRARSVR